MSPRLSFSFFSSYFTHKCISYRYLHHEIRKPKKKVALFIGYNGSGYQGMQANPGIRSIEKDIFDSLCQAGAVSKSNSVDLKKVQWVRAARTDKGVHAVGNVVSLKMIVQDSDIIQKINYYLPDQIRVWGYVETQKSFHAKKLCDSRKYEYLLPTYTLMPLFDQQQLQQQKEEIWKLKQQFRISKARLDQFKQVMTRFIGTHKFHNYTIKHDDSEMYVKRHIKSIIVDDPQVVNDNQMEWIRIHLHGQSFMLHQIRKMISMAILTLRTETPLSIIDRTFEDGKINIPKAPALGLLLNQPVYDGYNAKIDLDQREPILFDKYKVAMESFKKSYIDDTIFKTEMEHRIFDEFLDTFDKHYPIDLDYSYLNRQGVIPLTAYIT